MAAFKWASNDRRLPPLSHLVGLALLAGLALPAFQHMLSALVLHAATTTVLLIVAVWEEMSLGRSTRVS